MRYLIIGGGTAGLITAYSLSKRVNPTDITIIERASTLGGLLSGKYYPEEELYFDLGTHIFQETGNPEIDDIMIKSISSKDLIYFRDGQGDFSGSVLNGKLQTNSHFPDIRQRSDFDLLKNSISTHLNTSNQTNEIHRSDSFVNVASRRFGTKYTLEILSPILSNLYAKPSDEIAGFGLLLPGLTRLIANDELEWEQVSKSDKLRAIFAVPDQRKLPSELRNKKNSYYSKNFGTRSFIDGLKSQLNELGVNILTNTKITSLDTNQNSISYDIETNIKTLNYDRIVFATGIHGAANLLKVDLKKFNFDTLMTSRIVNITSNFVNETDLCYFYGLDSECDFYRVTNYHAFSGDSNDKRLTVEVLGDRDLSSTDLPQRISNQLCDIGFLKDNKINFSDVLNLNSGFPTPTTKNMNALNDLTKHVKSILPSNSYIAGIGAEECLFFQNEILEHAYRQSLTI